MLALPGGVAVAQPEAPADLPAPAIKPPPVKPAPEAPPPTGAIDSSAVAAPPPVAVPITPPKIEAEAPKAEPPKPVVPLKRPRYTTAVIQALDKVTAQTLRFEAQVGKPVRYKSLIFTVRACETTAPDEDMADSMAHMEIDSQPEAVPGRAAPQARQVFRGWMYSSSPSLNPFRHPAYDVWLIACKTASPSA